MSEETVANELRGVACRVECRPKERWPVDIITRIDEHLAACSRASCQEMEPDSEPVLLACRAEIERLVGLAAFASPDMVKWLTDQVMRRDNVIEAMKSAGMEQITKAFTENRWIPVEERLPIEQPIKEGFKEARVLAWDGEEVYEACYTAFHDPSDDGWSAFRSPPTHWMPLPEPPEAK